MTLLNNILPEIRRGKLKALLSEREIVRVLEAHNGLSGIIANNACIEGQSNQVPVQREFDAIWESSLTDSASKGHPDIEVVSFDSRLQSINEILAVTHKPMIVDGDTGGDANNFEYMVTKLERAGVSAVIIEDKVFPKRNSLEPGVQQILEEPEIFSQKIQRGKSAQISTDFMIIARLESLIAGKSVDDALFRAQIYLEAGADGVMIHSKEKDPAQIMEFTKHYQKMTQKINCKKPMVCVPTTYNTLTEDELRAAGFSIVIYANHLLRSANKAMEETARTILLNQRSFEVDPICSSVREIFQTVGFLEVKEKDKLDGNNKNIPIIIPAAGEDPSLSSILNGKPKSMLEIAGKTLLDWQISALNSNNLTNITVITGYKSRKMKAEGITFQENKDYKRGSELHSLMEARKKMTNGFIMLYSDILFEENIMSKILACQEDIVLIVDNTMQYHAPEANKIQDFVISKNKHLPTRRKISFAYENIISKIGSKLNPETATHEFIGLAKFTKTGAEQLLQTYEDCVKNYHGKLQEAENINQFKFTDLIQEMIDRGYVANFLEIHKGWLEIHSTEDIELANHFLSNS
jgi:phosphoenolpyruvate phosphomutase